MKFLDPDANAVIVVVFGGGGSGGDGVVIVNVVRCISLSNRSFPKTF